MGSDATGDARSIVQRLHDAVRLRAIGLVAGGRPPPPEFARLPDLGLKPIKFGPVRILAAEPPLFLTGTAYDEYLGLAPAFGRRYGNTPAAFIIFPTWSVETPALAGYNVLARPMWGWGVETGSHALRIICGGVFHRYPKAKLILGHLGETLPFQLWRFDSRSAPYGWNLPKPPSQYLKENVWVTTSGMYDLPPLRCSVDALGRDRVMFSADYPFDWPGCEFLDTVAIDEGLRADIAYNNAAKLLNL